MESHASLTYPNSQSVSAQETATYLRKLLHDRVVQHNLRVVAGYYKRIRSQRLCQLLGLAHSDLERHLAEVCVALSLPVLVIDMNRQTCLLLLSTFSVWFTDQL